MHIQVQKLFYYLKKNSVSFTFNEGNKSEDSEIVINDLVAIQVSNHDDFYMSVSRWISLDKEEMIHWPHRTNVMMIMLDLRDAMIEDVNIAEQRCINAQK